MIKLKQLTYDDLKGLRGESFELKYESSSLSYDGEGNYIHKYSSLDRTHSIELINTSRTILFTFYDNSKEECDVPMTSIYFNNYTYVPVDSNYLIYFQSIEERNLFLKENAKITYYEKVTEELIIK